ncbi:MAG: Fic family protein [Solirubrobacterales bacterium]
MDADRYTDSEFGSPRRLPGPHGYTTYLPKPIPRQIELPASTVSALAEAEGALGQLAGIGRLVPNPDLLIRPYLLREALSSTRIEGTQASMAEVLEADASGEAPSADIEEVLNYMEAMRAGIARLDQLPISVRLICELHGSLLAGVRGRELSPGELRRSPNWIGPAGSTINSAPFVPPPPEELPALLSDWEKFAHEQPEMPLLVQNALLHAQFETIHPFLDGNGRLGRLLLVFLLVARGRIDAPLLYLSAYLERNRDSYYDCLQAVRERGDPIPWVELFLAAVRTQSVDAVERAGAIIDLRERYREIALEVGGPNAAPLVELICRNPIATGPSVVRSLGVSRPTALRLLDRMEQQGILTEAATGPRGERRYVAEEMMRAVSGDEDE